MKVNGEARPNEVDSQQQPQHAVHSSFPFSFEENLPSRPSLIQSNELTSQTARTASPSDINTSSPPPAASAFSSQTIDDRFRETSTMAGTSSNGSAATHRPLTSSSSSSSSSLSVSTPSSNEHVTKKLPLLSSTSSARRPSISNPGVPTTLILSKVTPLSSLSECLAFSLLQDQKGSFGLTVTQRDHAIWIQSVQPHGPADQVRDTGDPKRASSSRFSARHPGGRSINPNQRNARRRAEIQ